MSYVSDLKITLLPSADYRRLAWLLTGFACTSLYLVYLPCCLVGLFSSMMIWNLWRITYHPFPYVGLRSLSFHNNKWLVDSGNTIERYEQIEIVVDSGFFLLIYFSNLKPKSSRRLLIFNDQLSSLELRCLHILALMTQPNANDKESAQVLSQ